MEIVILLPYKDSTGTYGADSSNYNVDVTGGTNTFTLDHGTSALAATLDLDWIIKGRKYL